MADFYLDPTEPKHKGLLATAKRHKAKKQSGDKDDSQSSSDSDSKGGLVKTAAQAGLKYLAGSFKRGGRVKKTGYAKVHKGERVLTRKQARRYRSK